GWGGERAFWRWEGDAKAQGERCSEKAWRCGPFDFEINVVPFLHSSKVISDDITTGYVLVSQAVYARDLTRGSFMRQDQTCNEIRPRCLRCQKANLVCGRASTEGGTVFLSENDYAAGYRKRPRGPDVRMTSFTHSGPRFTSTNPGNGLEEAFVEETQPCYLGVPQSAPDVPLVDQVLAYYWHFWIERPDGWPEIAYSHLKYAVPHVCCAQPQSILGLSVFAVSHAAFARAGKSRAAMTRGFSYYSEALVKTNVELKNINLNKALGNDVLLSVMLLSFYENSVTQKTSKQCSNVSQLMTGAFTHHDGAMAMLTQRRQSFHKATNSTELDKLVRRSLIRSALLRSSALPPWLQDGSNYGEHGVALGLDHCMVAASRLRNEIHRLVVDNSGVPPPCTEARAGQLLAYRLPPEYLYRQHMVEQNQLNEKLFQQTIHIYATAGHAGVWNRYRALRLITNDSILKCTSISCAVSESDQQSLKERALSRIAHLSDDVCASIPYFLGFVRIDAVAGYDTGISIEIPKSLKDAVRASSASMLAWPLAMATFVDGIPQQHRLYLADRLRDVGEIVDDGALGRIAAGFQ
ncbi:MAG: hypothetical protein Q9226_000747, partial [Calogaya cf. arnoldii]